MKNQFMITISDINGIRQYTLNQFIKVVAKWVLLGVIFIIVIGAILLKTLSVRVDDYALYTQELKDSQQELIDQNIKLKKEHKALLLQKKELEDVKHTLISKNLQLKQNITDDSQKLESMNEHLQEIEKKIGLEPEIDAAFADRIKAANIQADNQNHKKFIQKKLSKALTTTLEKNIPNDKPIPYQRVSSKFGYRTHPISHKKSFHAGIDLVAKKGTPVRATADGVVSFVGRKGGYGNFILLNHAYGFETAYGHLNSYKVKKGEYVYKGNIIGYVGTTGRSTGPHLHYEIRYLNKWLNPSKYLNWNTGNYASIMNIEKAVNWASLIKQINYRIKKSL